MIPTEKLYSLSGHVLQRRRVVRVLVWPCRLQRRLQPCRLFLRVYTISPVTVNSNIAWRVDPSGNVGYYVGIGVGLSYGLFYHHSYIYTNCMKGAIKYETT